MTTIQNLTSYPATTAALTVADHLATVHPRSIRPDEELNRLAMSCDGVFSELQRSPHLTTHMLTVFDKQQKLLNRIKTVEATGLEPPNLSPKDLLAILGFMMAWKEWGFISIPAFLGGAYLANTVGHAIWQLFDFDKTSDDWKLPGLQVNLKQGSTNTKLAFVLDSTVQAETAKA